MGETKNLLLRLDPVLAERLQALADVEGQSVSDVVRAAIADHIRRRRRDPTFKRLIEQNQARHRRLLDMLADDEPS